MQMNIVTLDRFKALLEAYGPNPAHWPQEEQSGAEALLRASAEARLMRDGERDLDSFLDALPEPPPASAQLRMLVLQEGVAARRMPLWKRWLQLTGDMLDDLLGAGLLRPAGVALAASLCLGFALGGFLPAPSAQASVGNVDIVELALLSDTFTGSGY